jgi:protein-L-isoaspartate(D-aspartate) O-methyltransferase
MVDRQLRDRGIKDERVLQAMGRMPRHLFVPVECRDNAYADIALPMGEEQTISQPYMVGAMLDALAIDPSFAVLEVGTGSGYLTALLAELAGHVYSVERLPRLAQSAESILRALNYTNVTIQVGDGSVGLPQSAPFDAIVVSAAAPEVPEPLVQQLKNGGRMVVPVGPAQVQTLQLVTKRQGKAEVRALGACRFVPLIGERGYKTGWQG